MESEIDITAATIINDYEAAQRRQRDELQIRRVSVYLYDIFINIISSYLELYYLL